MKIKVGELSGNALDWSVAKCEGQHAVIDDGYVCSSKTVLFEEYKFLWQPSTNWEQGGVIIEREGIALLQRPMGYWVASLDRTCEGDAPLIASMRCYVASKLGDEVEIPDELFEGVEQ